MMSIDREKLEEYKAKLADRYTAYELVERLEDAGLLDVWTILEMFEDLVMELHDE